jgi:hypothetical protein
MGRAIASYSQLSISLDILPDIPLGILPSVSSGYHLLLRSIATTGIKVVKWEFHL